MNNVHIRLTGLFRTDGSPITLMKELPLDHQDPDIDYLANFSEGDNITLNAHGSKGVLRAFSAIHGRVLQLGKWMRLNPRKLAIQSVSLHVREFHVSTYKSGNILSPEHGQEDILADGWTIE